MLQVYLYHRTGHRGWILHRSGLDAGSRVEVDTGGVSDTLTVHTLTENRDVTDAVYSTPDTRAGRWRRLPTVSASR